MSSLDRFDDADSSKDCESPSPLRAQAKPQMPTIGRIVHFVMPDAFEHKMTEDGQYIQVPVERPAIIVKVWERNDGEMPLVQLQVFTDGTNDGTQYATGISWQTSVHYDEHKSLRSWHWPELIV